MFEEDRADMKMFERKTSLSSTKKWRCPFFFCPPFTWAFVAQREASAAESPDGIEACSPVQFLHLSELSVLVLSCDSGLRRPSLVLARSLGSPTWIVVAASMFESAV